MKTQPEPKTALTDSQRHVCKLMGIPEAVYAGDVPATAINESSWVTARVLLPRDGDGPRAVALLTGAPAAGITKQQKKIAKLMRIPESTFAQPGAR